MVLAEASKRCSKCGVVHPMSFFYVVGKRKDGQPIAGSWCKACCRSYQKERLARRRIEMGEDAFLAHRAEVVRRSRERRDYDTEKRQTAAWREAVRELIAAHRKEWDARYRAARYRHGLSIDELQDPEPHRSAS